MVISICCRDLEITPKWHRRLEYMEKVNICRQRLGTGKDDDHLLIFRVKLREEKCNIC